MPALSMENGPAQLRSWRQREGFSQAIAAVRLDIAQSSYSEWETGKKTPEIVSLGRIRRETGISLEAWLPEDLRLPEAAPAQVKPRARRPTRRPAAA